MTDVYTNGTGGGKWHDASTWQGGSVPDVNDRIIVQSGDTLTVEGVCEFGDGYRSTSLTEANARLVIKPGATLKASRTADSELRCKGNIYGHCSSSGIAVFDWGTDSDPIPANVNAVVDINYDQSFKRGYYYGIDMYAYNSSHYPKFYAQSAHRRRRETYLTSAVSAGATTFTVADATGWQVGDTLRFAPQYKDSDSANPSGNREFESATISAISGNDITVSAPLTYAHGYDNEADKEAGVVVNLTSNVRFTSHKDKIFYIIRVYRGETVVKNVEFAYANNAYNYVSAPLQVVYAGYYAGADIQDNTWWSDMSGINYHQYSLWYMYSSYSGYPITLYGNVGVGLASKAGKSYRSGYYPFVAYYGGQPLKYENCVTMAGTGYRGEYGFEAYQCPITLHNCKSIGFGYGYHLHNNVNPDTNNCWSIGNDNTFNTYNGTAIYNDMKVRWNKYLSVIWANWRGSATMYRPDFTDGQLYASYANLNLIHRNSPLPTGNLMKLVDVQNDTNKQTWYYSYGTIWWDTTITRNDPHSIAIASLSDTNPTTWERQFEATTGDAMLVGLYVKNISTNYIGTLTLSILQGSEVIATQEFDLTTLTPNQWTLLSISGTATKTMNTTFRMEYKGNGGKIAMTDFQQPFTADQKAQAKAVWAELLSENHQAGSFGELVGKKLLTLSKWIGLK